MRAVALQKASGHLALAKSAMADLRLEQGFDAYEVAWSQFLSQVSRFYSKMEQGAKGCKKSEPWFGRKKAERRKDPLLSYIHHARDCDEHTLQMVTERVMEGFDIPVNFVKGQEVVALFTASERGDGAIEVSDFEVRTGDKVFNQGIPFKPRVVLLPVTDDRYHDTFLPPQEHLGEVIKNPDPNSIAALAIRYIEKMLAEASSLPTHV